MKVFFVNESDYNGGAARAMLRIIESMKDTSVVCNILVNSRANKGSDSITINDNYFIRLMNKLYRYSLQASLGKKYSIEINYHTQLVRNSFLKTVKTIKPDIIHLHWIGYDMFKLSDLAELDIPVVWTMHDMWPFTGGCNYDWECKKFQRTCGYCPLIQSNKEYDISRKNYNKKREIFNSIKNLKIVSPSNWLAGTTKESSLFSGRDIEVIPNTIDVNKYKPIDKSIARSILNLPLNKKIVLYGAVGGMKDLRKGAKYLISALQSLNKSDLTLVTFGANENSAINNSGIDVINMKKLYDDYTLSLVYSAADVTVVPSIQENLSLTIMESLSCGTPVAAFNIGGNSDMIVHLDNGFLATPYEEESLAEGIMWIINYNDYNKLSLSARHNCMNNYAYGKIASQYISLYKSLLHS